MDKVHIFKRVTDYDRPRWVVRRPKCFEQSFLSWEEAVAFARNFIDRVSEIRPNGNCT